MKIAYFDCFAGVSGDMTLGALVDLGVDPAFLDGAVRGLGVTGFVLEVSTVRRAGIAAAKVDVRLTDAQPERHLHEIEAILDAGPLDATVRERARRVFRRLTEAEARVHRMPVERVHLHEVGALDAIVDVVGACAGLQALGVERVMCAPVVTGSGTTTSQHGVIPVPAPATVELLRGVPVRPGPVAFEMTTPTGAALVTTLAEGFGPMPAMRVLAAGYGAGSRSFEEVPNLLRIVLGEEEAGAGAGEGGAALIEANLDDATPQLIGYVTTRLLEAGALDAWVTPAVMKKGRPGHVLAVLAPPALEVAMRRILFRETTTIGVRARAVGRHVLERRLDEVGTPYGRVRVKVALDAGVLVNAVPEYEDCVTLARARDVPLKEVQAAAIDAWRRLQARGGATG